jgi:hypothetical protein
VASLIQTRFLSAFALGDGWQGSPLSFAPNLRSASCVAVCCFRCIMLEASHFFSLAMRENESCKRHALYISIYSYVLQCSLSTSH